jgi:nickel transport protein
MSALLVFVAILLGFPRPALAHKLHVFARVEGNSIQGKAYFPGDVPVQAAQVTALAPDGREIGRTTTDQEGNFTLPASLHCDYRLVVDAHDGHGAEFTVHAAELPGDPPAGGQGPADQTGAASLVPRPSPLAPAGGQGLAGEIDALRRQVVQLRQQTDESEQRLRFRDVLGGIGYILGLAGVACYVLAAKRRRQERP